MLILNCSANDWSDSRDAAELSEGLPFSKTVTHIHIHIHIQTSKTVGMTSALH